MSEIISFAYVITCSKSGVGGSWNYSMISLNEDHNLNTILFEYYDKLGVDKYEKYKDGEIRWRLRDKWFDSFQIERMLRLSVFS